MQNCGRAERKISVVLENELATTAWTELQRVLHFIYYAQDGNLRKIRSGMEDDRDNAS